MSVRRRSRKRDRKKVKVRQEFGFLSNSHCTHDLAAATFHADVTAYKIIPHSLKHTAT